MYLKTHHEFCQKYPKSKSYIQFIFIAVKYGLCEICLCFWKETLTKAAFIRSKNCQNCEIFLQFKIAVFYVNIHCNKLSFIAETKAEFSALLIQSFRNHSNMLIFCSRNISDYYQCWKHQKKEIVETVTHCIIQDALMNRKIKRTAFIWNRNRL